MDNRTFDEQYERAKRAAEAADAIEPRANAAYYDRASHLIVIHLRNGESFTFSPTVVEELAHGSPDELGQIEVSPSGDGLSWPALDVDLGLVSLMHMTSGPAATAAMPPSGDALESLEQLYAQIEIAWMQRRAVPLVDQLAMRYPGYKDELHEFLALLVDDALGELGAKEEIQRSVERTQEWLTTEGYTQAEQAARESHQYSITADLAGDTGAGERGATSSGGSDASEETEQLPLGYVGLIHQSV